MPTILKWPKTLMSVAWLFTGDNLLASGKGACPLTMLAVDLNLSVGRHFMVVEYLQHHSVPPW